LVKNEDIQERRSFRVVPAGMVMLDEVVEAAEVEVAVAPLEEEE
jgi:hypothetical protein